MLALKTIARSIAAGMPDTVTVATSWRMRTRRSIQQLCEAPAAIFVFLMGLISKLQVTMVKQHVAHQTEAR